MVIRLGQKARFAILIVALISICCLLVPGHASAQQPLYYYQPTLTISPDNSTTEQNVTFSVNETANSYCDITISGGDNNTEIKQFYVFMNSDGIGSITVEHTALDERRVQRHGTLR